MTTRDTKRCDHLACICEVPLAQETCSDYCASPAGRDAHNVQCECGHADCTRQSERQLHGGAGRESI